jgi:hypothetical protein
MKKAMRNAQKSSPWLGVLPFIGTILFLIFGGVRFFAPHLGNWREAILLDAVVFMVGWAGIGAGIAHLFFGERISASIGFKNNPYEWEVGCCDLCFGIVGVLCPRFSPPFWLAIILFSSLYRIGCGIGHIREIVKARNYAINNTAILAINFLVPAFLLWAYHWAIH